MVTEKAEGSNYLWLLPDKNSMRVGHILGSSSNLPGAKVVGYKGFEGKTKVLACSVGGANKGKCAVCMNRKECPEG